VKVHREGPSSVRSPSMVPLVRVAKKTLGFPSRLSFGGGLASPPFKGSKQVLLCRSRTFSFLSGTFPHNVMEPHGFLLLSAPFQAKTLVERSCFSPFLFHFSSSIDSSLCLFPRIPSTVTLEDPFSASPLFSYRGSTGWKVEYAVVRPPLFGSS